MWARNMFPRLSSSCFFFLHAVLNKNKTTDKCKTRWAVWRRWSCTAAATDGSRSAGTGASTWPATAAPPPSPSSRLRHQPRRLRHRPPPPPSRPPASASPWQQPSQLGLDQSTVWLGFPFFFQPIRNIHSFWIMKHRPKKWIMFLDVSSQQATTRN